MLARRAAEIVGRVDAAAAELSAMVGLQTGRVRIAGFQSALSTLVPQAATALRNMHPDIELSLADAHPQVALHMLREGDVDAALIFRYDDVIPEGVRVTHLFDDPMYLLSLDPGQTLLEHRDSPWIAGCEHCRREFIDACQNAGFTPHIAYASDEIIVEQALVAAGMGVTTMPGLACAPTGRPASRPPRSPDSGDASMSPPTGNRPTPGHDRLHHRTAPRGQRPPSSHHRGGRRLRPQIRLCSSAQAAGLSSLPEVLHVTLM